MAIRLSTQFGIVVRKQALQRIGVDKGKLLALLEAVAPYDEDDDLISLGPHFGAEAADEGIRRLKNLGLEYPDDFFDLSADVPDWCGLSCFIAKRA
jgi:hypothetical protein